MIYKQVLVLFLSLRIPKATHLSLVGGLFPLPQYRKCFVVIFLSLPTKKLPKLWHTVTMMYATTAYMLVLLVASFLIKGSQATPQAMAPTTTSVGATVGTYLVVPLCAV